MLIISTEAIYKNVPAPIESKIDSNQRAVLWGNVAPAIDAIRTPEGTMTAKNRIGTMAFRHENPDRI